MQSREAGEGNDKAYVIAAGRANHAGEGGWKGLSGNSSVYGLEIEHTGTSTLPMHRQQTAARIHAAMIDR
jgi:N-acetyl-anhydromuramyl-L-alanine amidase AmpD